MYISKPDIYYRLLIHTSCDCCVIQLNHICHLLLWLGKYRERTDITFDCPHLNILDMIELGNKESKQSNYQSQRCQKFQVAWYRCGTWLNFTLYLTIFVTFIQCMYKLKLFLMGRKKALIGLL